MGAIGCGEEYFAGKTFTADSNYHDPTNLKKCDEEGLDAYIPDNRFRRRDLRFRVKSTNRLGVLKKFTSADFRRHEERDEYLCPNGKVFRFQVGEVVIDGVIYRRYVKDRGECQKCALKPRCIKGKRTNRRYLMVPLGGVPGNLSKAMVAKVDSEKGRRIYPQRIAIVEPVFANIKIHKGMNRFTLRSRIKVNIQWMLYCMIHNIGKILKYSVHHAFA